MTENKSFKQELLDFVQSEYDGYTDVKNIGERESLKVYQVLTDDNTDGEGVFVLIDEDNMTFADSDQTDEIKHFFKLGEWYARKFRS